MKPGMYPDISNEDYHAGPGLSSSGVKQILKSPLHYKHQYIDGNKSGGSAAMALGTIVHTLVLEPSLFDDEYVVVEASTKNTEIFKTAAAEFSEMNVILKSEYEKGSKIAAAALEHPKAASLLEGSLREHSMYWDESGRLCKCRPDIWRPDIRVCADLKTATDASPKTFQRSVINFGYHTSAAWYMRGIEQVEAMDLINWAWIVVETSEPFAVQIYVADEALLSKGFDLWKEAIATLNQCESTDAWPSYSEHILPITLPAWAA